MYVGGGYGYDWCMRVSSLIWFTFLFILPSPGAWQPSLPLSDNCDLRRLTPIAQDKIKKGKKQWPRESKVVIRPLCNRRNIIHVHFQIIIIVEQSSCWEASAQNLYAPRLILRELRPNCMVKNWTTATTTHLSQWKERKLLHCSCFSQDHVQTIGTPHCLNTIKDVQVSRLSATWWHSFFFNRSPFTVSTFPLNGMWCRCGELAKTSVQFDRSSCRNMTSI